VRSTQPRQRCDPTAAIRSPSTDAPGDNHETVIACIDNGSNLEAVDELGRSALSYMASNNNANGMIALLEVHTKTAVHFL
jgi:ankyrin repeat protein